MSPVGIGGCTLYLVLSTSSYSKYKSKSLRLQCPPLLDVYTPCTCRPGMGADIGTGANMHRNENASILTSSRRLPRRAGFEGWVCHGEVDSTKLDLLHSGSGPGPSPWLHAWTRVSLSEFDPLPPAQSDSERQNLLLYGVGKRATINQRTVKI